MQGPGRGHGACGASLWCHVADEPRAPEHDPLSFNRVESMQVDPTPSPARKVSPLLPGSRLTPRSLWFSQREEAPAFQPCWAGGPGGPEQAGMWFIKQVLDNGFQRAPLP